MLHLLSERWHAVHKSMLTGLRLQPGYKTDGIDGHGSMSASLLNSSDERKCLKGKAQPYVQETSTYIRWLFMSDKFEKGDIVIGNERAQVYSITTQGWKGVVLDILISGDIKVKPVNGVTTYYVDQRCFDLYKPITKDMTKRQEQQFTKLL